MFPLRVHKGQRRFLLCLCGLGLSPLSPTFLIYPTSICIATKTALRQRPHSGAAIITAVCRNLVSLCKFSQQAVRDFTRKGTSRCGPFWVADSRITYEYSSTITPPAIDHIFVKPRYCGFVEKSYAVTLVCYIHEQWILCL